MSHESEVSLPDVTDADLMQAVRSTKAYTIVILKTGPKYQPPDPQYQSPVARIIWEHGKRNHALRLAGLMPIVCPILDDSDVTGIGVFNVGPAEVEKIMSGDPGVQAGIFTYQIHPARSFPGSTLPS
jgi:hypothetical protein